MDVVYLMLFFLLGLIFGSFFNVVGLRIPKKESIVYPNSHCPSCQHELSWFENIPVLSYIILKGKCRHCKTHISPIYPVVELVTGFLYAFTFYKLGFQMELAIGLLLASLLVIITVSDWVYMLIPNRVLLFFLVFIVGLRIVEPLDPWWDVLLGAAVGFGILYLLAVVSKGGMGGGDIKLFFVLGLFLGTKATVMTLFLASIIGAIFGFIQIILKGYEKRRPIPFGPFIAIGAILAYFYTDEMINWYIEMFIY